jgi:two-component system, OmpR family, sensor histidine kinase CiaH
MIERLRKQSFAFITVVFWFLLIYIIAALVWWFIALENQNTQMFSYKLEQMNRADTAFQRNLAQISDERERKTAQYIGEGATFLLVILVGAVFVYRATRKQIRLSQQQQNFMMAVTHELKTPIAVTRLNLETLQKHLHELDESKQQKLVSISLQETDRLNELTNNILIAAQLESGRYQLNKQEIDFSKLIVDAVQNFKHRFPHRAIEAQVQENIFVTGEANLLLMLANNLMDNAIKYSPEGSLIKVELKKNDHKAILKIADEGEGIPDDEKKKVFEKFYRIGNESTRSAKGTGLGLYLCKRIVQDHKGSISVQNNSPRGSIFTVTLHAIER